MSEGDPRDAYDEAMKVFRRTQEAAKNLKAVLNKASSAMNYKLPEFLLANFGVQTPGLSAPRLREATINLAEWPDGETMKKIIREWHQSLLQARAAYEKIPPEKRGTISEPPHGLSLPG